MMTKSNTAPAENKMGTMPVGRLLAGMAIPMMISMLVQAFYNVVDSVFVAQLSQDALNAVSLAFPLQNLMIAVGGGTAVGMNALLSRSLGEKRQDMADRAANTGIFLALCSFVVFAVAGLLFSRTFFLAQTDNAVIVEYGTPIQKAAQDAQENVRKAIETMTGLHVVRVHVHVQGVSFEKENSVLEANKQVKLEAGEAASKPVLMPETPAPQTEEPTQEPQG